MLQQPSSIVDAWYDTAFFDATLRCSPHRQSCVLQVCAQAVCDRFAEIDLNVCIQSTENLLFDPTLISQRQWLLPLIPIGASSTLPAFTNQHQTNPHPLCWCGRSQCARNCSSDSALGSHRATAALQCRRKLSWMARAADMAASAACTARQA